MLNVPFIPILCQWQVAKTKWRWIAIQKLSRLGGFHFPTQLGNRLEPDGHPCIDYNDYNDCLISFKTGMFGVPGVSIGQELRAFHEHHPQTWHSSPSKLSFLNLFNEVSTIILSCHEVREKERKKTWDCAEHWPVSMGILNACSSLMDHHIKKIWSFNKQGHPQAPKKGNPMASPSPSWFPAWSAKNIWVATTQL